MGHAVLGVHRAGRPDAALPRVCTARREPNGVLSVSVMSVLSWPELRPVELSLMGLLALIVILVVLRVRGAGAWVDVLLLLSFAAVGALLKHAVTR